MSKIINVELPRAALAIKSDLVTYGRVRDTLLLRIMSAMFDGFINESMELNRELLLSEIRMGVKDILLTDTNVSKEKANREALVITEGVLGYFDSLENDLLKIIENNGINPLKVGIINIIGNTMVIGR